MSANSIITENAMPSLRDVIDAIVALGTVEQPVDVVAVATWLDTVSTGWGRRPLDLLREGRADLVLEDVERLKAGVFS